MVSLGKLLRFFIIGLIAGWATACEPATEDFLPTPTALADPAVTLVLPTPLPPTNTPIAIETPVAATTLPTCGLLLPILPADSPTPITRLQPNPDALAALLAQVPDDARPAMDQILARPSIVGLAAYRVGQAENGAYLNADVAMPLASVVKLVQLIAYAEAVAAGDLNPLTTVTLAEIEAYYQPGLDLAAHPFAVTALEQTGRLFGDPPAMLLDVVPEMMIEFSDNSATDYLHMLLGQRTIEQTAINLGLTQQSAICPFVGQFLAMGNHTRADVPDDAALRRYLQDPASYGEDAIGLTLLYSSSQAFREEAIAWRQATRRPTGQTQRAFSAALNAHGSAGEYARLMAQIAVNGLSTPESSYLARRYLEWPNRFAANRELFSNVGFKGGALPGILTLVYYAYPQGEFAPVAVALFFRDLDGNTYRTWRQTLPHDALARWLLSDPTAIPLLRAMLESAEN